MLAPTTV